MCLTFAGTVEVNRWSLRGLRQTHDHKDKEDLR